MSDERSEKIYREKRYGDYLLVYSNFEDLSNLTGRSINEREFVGALLRTPDLQALYIGPHMNQKLEGLPTEKIMSKPLAPRSLFSQMAFQLWLFWILIKTCMRERGKVIIISRPNYFSIAAPLVSLLMRVCLITKDAGLGVVDLQTRTDTPFVFRKLLIKLLEFNMRRSNGLWVVTSQIGEYWEKHIPTENKRIFLLPNGANTRLFNLDNSQPLPREILQCIPKARYYGCYAGFFQDTGGERIISAIKLLKDNGDDYALLFAGYGNGEDQLKSFTRDQGLEDRVIFLGLLPYQYMPSLYHFCDVLFAVYPRNFVEVIGSSSQKVFQYLACGRPVVASRTSGHEALSRKYFGELVDPQDIEELAAAIKKVCESAEYNTIEIAQARHDYIAQKHSYERLVDELLYNLNYLIY